MNSSLKPETRPPSDPSRARELIRALKKFARPIGRPVRRCQRWLKDELSIDVLRTSVNTLLALGNRRKPRSLSYPAAVALHGRFPKRDIYKYDLESKRSRAQDRYWGLGYVVDLQQVKRVAELGAGDGQLALKFFKEGYQVEIVDIEDWRDPDVKQADIAFRHVRENEPFGIPAGSVDLFVSYGTLEHVRDPEFAVREMIRATRPGGCVYSYFGPLYNSAWGLHAYRTYYAPYPQFLLEESVLERFKRENGVYDLGRDRNDFQYVNRWPFMKYRALFDSLAKEVEQVRIRTFPVYEHLGLVCRHLSCFWGRELSFDELTIDGIELLIELRPGGVALHPNAGKARAGT